MSVGSDNSPDSPGSAADSGDSPAARALARAAAAAAEETGTAAAAAEKAAENGVVQSMGNSGGVGEKKRRGRPPGSGNKNKSTAPKPTERAGFGEPCTRAQAESSAAVCLSFTTPAYNSLFMVLGRPEIQKEETDMQRNMLIEYAMQFGDPLGKYGPIIGLVLSGLTPITLRIMPADFGGMTHDSIRKMREMQAEEERKNAKLKAV